MGLAAIVVTVLAALLVQTSQHKTALREVNNAVSFFDNTIHDQEQSWEEAAIRYRGRIEFMRLLENPATRWEQFGSYLTTQASGEIFPSVLITDIQDRVLFRYGFEESNSLASFPHYNNDRGWYYHEQSKTLYRYFVQSIWLGKEGMGHLILARPLDNAWLYQLTLPDTHLFARWHAQTIASSLGEHGLNIHLGNEDGLMEHDGKQYGQGRFLWEKGNNDSPAIIVHHHTDALFTFREILTFALAAILTISLLLWAALGFWMTRTSRRIRLLQQASQEFIESRQATSALDVCLQDAGGQEDEIKSVAKSMGNLIFEVTRHNAERDAYESNLRNSEAKVRQITSVMGDGLYVLDQDGNVTFLNTEAEHLLGWSEAELMGKNGHEIFHYQTPDGQPITVEDCPVHRTILTGGTYRSPNDWLVRRDGRILPVSIVSSPIVENGKVTGSVAAFHDITQQLEAEKTLREREKRFRLLFNSGSDAILVHLLNVEDGRGKFVEVNNVACSRLGYSRDELLQMSPADIDDPESTSDMGEIAQQIHTNGFAMFERTHVTKTGEKIPVEVSSHVFEMDDTPMLMSVVRDISERKQSELEYKTILQTTRDGFLVVDTRDNSFIDANDAYCAMLGYTREEILKLHTADVEAQESSEETKAHVSDLIAHGYGRFETRHRHKNGQLLDVEISLHYLAIKGGVFITFIRDISERIRTEAVQEEMKRDQRALLDATRESAILMERSGIILAINQTGAKRLRSTVDELMGKNIYGLLPPELAKVRRERNEKSFQDGVPSIQEDERDGMRLLTSIYPVIDANGEINRVALYSADVTERRMIESIENLFSTINQQVLQGMPLENVLKFICEEVVVLFHLDLVWVGRKEPDGAVSVSTSAGTAQKYAQLLRTSGVRWDDSPLGQGPTGTAICTGQTKIFSVNDPAFQTWFAIAHEFGFQAILGIPLMAHGEIYGAFTMYSRTPSAFAEATVVKRLTGIADRVSMALEMAMDMQQIRLLSMALTSAANAVLVTDNQGRIQWINAAFTRLSGYSAEETIGQSPRILKSGQQEQAYYQTLWQTINSGEVWSSETVEKSKNGSLYTVMQTITPLLDESGKITHFIAIHEDITNQKRTQERIQHMAQYDSLTDMPNRALFYDRLCQAVNLAKRSKVGLALLFLDLDRFKQVNDTLGHHVGDMLLKSVAERLRQCVRESDTAARLGGDEFTVLLYDLREREDIGRVAEKIIESISMPYELEGHDIHIGVSIGIARFSDDTENEDKLMKLADKAMYAAKSAGRNTYRFCVNSQ